VAAIFMIQKTSVTCGSFVAVTVYVRVSIFNSFVRRIRGLCVRSDDEILKRFSGRKGTCA
jgi:hypothetical protein